MTASMHLVNEILSNERMERMDKIERIEAILSAATASTASASDSPSASITLSSSELSERATGGGSSSCCSCDCHSANIRYLRDPAPGSGVKSVVEAGCQTLSTGDIVITKVFFPEGDSSASDICLTPSPKKNPKPY